ncbi:MAG: histidinol dehydrogenase [Clostridiales bacterium]|nr:histidinol dehydrogenase [Clostridiales bacterium]
MIKIFKYGEVDNGSIFDRTTKAASTEKTVSEIIADVRKRGDTALYEYSEKFDNAKLTSLEVSDEEFDEAQRSVDAEFLKILRDAAENIKRFHGEQVRNGFTIKGERGEILGQRIIPIEKVGLYVPGGTAAYPSTVLMDAIPAKLAGCSEIVMVTPPNKEGKVSAPILAAAKIAGITKVFKIGGAQAIAALAYGTDSVPRVYKIVGPGNAYVAEAKKQVFGQVSIDMIAGPSEILVIADGKSNAGNVAADMLSQAEHDRFASAVLVTDSAELAEKVRDEIERQLPLLEREEIARASIENNGKIIVAEDFDKVIEISNEIAPEHLELCVDEPFDMLEKVKNAGSVFLGRFCPEALGDYFAGPNHTLPTSGTAKFSSPLSVDDFVKRSQFIYYPKEAFESVALSVDRFAREEGLTGHGRSATIRLEETE